MISDQNTGNVSRVSVTGTWNRKGEVHINLQYTSVVNNKDGIRLATVYMRSIYAGQLTRIRGRTWRFNGYTSLFSPAYLGQNLEAYQIITAFGEVNSDVPSVVLPFRALTPYNLTTRPTTPIAPYYVYGQLTGVDMNDGLLHANIQAQTINGAVTIAHGRLISDYVLRKENSDVIDITNGLVVDLDSGDRYFIDNTQIMLE